MERSTKITSVSNYEQLAKYYDLLLNDEEAYSYWLKYIEEKKFDSCLELASGSGMLTGILEKKGYSILASDISESMKEAAKANFSGDYLILNMINFELNKTFDLVLCCCDSINYLEEDELDSMFKCVYKHLNTGGRFIFDAHSVKRLEEFKEEYIEEGNLDDVDYQWTILADKESKTISEHFVFYTNDGMFEENHTQNVYPTDVYMKKLVDCGFNVRLIDDFVEDEKVLFIASK